MLERAARLEVRDFPTRKPVKRRGNRRYYQWNTVGLIRQIRALLYKQGYAVNAAPQDCG
jgi:DNA-binding transcriptional MerR regulator